MTHATYDALRQVIHDVRRRWRLKVALRGAAIVLAASLATVAASALALDHFRYEPWAVSSLGCYGLKLLSHSDKCPAAGRLPCARSCFACRRTSSAKPLSRLRALPISVCASSSCPCGAA